MLNTHNTLCGANSEGINGHCDRNVERYFMYLRSRWHLFSGLDRLLTLTLEN